MIDKRTLGLRNKWTMDPIKPQHSQDRPYYEEESWILGKTCCQWNFSEKPPAYACMKNDWAGKVIHWEIYKKMKFDHTNIRCMHNTAPVLETNTHKLLWDFDIHSDHLISARRPNLIIKGELAKLSTVPIHHWITVKECEKKEKYLDLPW